MDSALWPTAFSMFMYNGSAPWQFPAELGYFIYKDRLMPSTVKLGAFSLRRFQHFPPPHHVTALCPCEIEGDEFQTQYLAK